jgi:hypothetical protein
MFWLAIIVVSPIMKMRILQTKRLFLGGVHRMAVKSWRRLSAHPVFRISPRL